MDDAVAEDVEAADYMEDDPAAWEAWVDCIGRFGPRFARLAATFDADAAASVLGGAMLSYLADTHGLYLARSAALFQHKEPNR